jgi:8-oxo-dGTP pyrophosphatase MutT (NUDIX family)
MPISEYLKNLRRKIGNDLILLPAVSAIIINDAGEVLLHRSADDGNWYVIGGSPEPNEEPALAAVREAHEETGLIVTPTRFVGVYVDGFRQYPNGDQVTYTAMVFRCRPIGGELKVADDESLEVRYFRPDQLPALQPVQRLKVEHAYDQNREPYFAWNEAWLKNL